MVEDDKILGDGISTGLRQDGFTVDWIRRGDQVASAVEFADFALLLLDLGLPGMDGMQVIQQLRKQGNNLPILVLTARDTTDDKVKGLDAGADDYLIKPLDINELGARVRALIRRSKGSGDPEMSCGELVMKPASHEALFQGEQLDLSPKEYSVLHILMRQAGKVVSKSRLQESIYGWDESVESNAMEVHIHHLRKKLGKEAIRTIRGVGYMLENIQQ